MQLCNIIIWIFEHSTYKRCNFITSERSERSSYYQSYMDRFVDIQTALRPFRKIGKKLKLIFMTIIGLAESFKTMNWISPARRIPAQPWRSLTAHLSESIKDKDENFFHNLHTSLQFMLLKFSMILSLIFLKLCAFWQHSKFRLKWKC